MVLRQSPSAQKSDQCGRKKKQAVSNIPAHVKDIAADQQQITTPAARNYIVYDGNTQKEYYELEGIEQHRACFLSTCVILVYNAKGVK